MQTGCLAGRNNHCLKYNKDAVKQMQLSISPPTVACIFLFLSITALKGDGEGISTVFTEKDSAYTFKADFVMQKDPQCIIHILYDFEYLPKFVTSMDSIVLIRRDTSWYDVRYVYNYLFFGCAVTFRKQLHTEDKSVTFVMTDISQNSPFFIPKILAMSGEYRVNAINNAIQLSYVQNIVLESRILNWFAVYFSRKEAIKTIKTLKKYIEQSCIRYRK